MAPNWKIVSKRLICICAITFCLIAVILIAFAPRNPSGRYRVDNISWEGISYYEFKDGRVNLILCKSDQKGGNIIEEIGTYSKENGQWTYAASSNSPRMLLQATCCSLRISALDGGFPKKYRRIFGNPEIRSN